MNFFEHQDAARRRTGWLVVMFVFAVLGIIALVYLAVTILALYLTRGEMPFWDWRIMAGASAATLLVVGGGSLFKLLMLRGGGQAVAESLGGRLVDTGAEGLDERKLLNVVQEMAIAAGTPVPQVYVMDGERGINAFAAGYAPGDAVIGVTRGCMQQLDRDELQGVIAHEFSHILNGDMRLNIRLIGIVHGILVIGLLGWAIMRSVFYSPTPRRSSRDGGGGQALLAILAFGGALCVIGFVGTLFGNLIKSAVSRQREYLADASAVQFTRNPDGIGGALMKIGGASEGSKMGSPRAPEISHMLFAQGFSKGIIGLLATHPPLPRRIRRILPRWDGEFLAVASKPPPAPRATEPSRRPRVGPLAVAAAAAAAAQRQGSGASGSVLERIGQPGPEQIAYAGELLQRMPERLRAAASDPYDARALIYAFLLVDDPDTRRIQMERLAEHADEGVHRTTVFIAPLVARLDLELRLPLIDTALAALRQMSPKQYDVFQANVAVLMQADESIDLFEWVLRRIIVHDLEPHFKGVPRKAVHYYALQGLAGPCSTLLSTLAHFGHDALENAARAFDAGAKPLGVPGVALLPRDRCGLGELDDALRALDTVAPKLKRPLLEACATCIAFDRQVTVLEGELFRAIGGALGCPTPPLLPGQPLV